MSPIAHRSSPPPARPGLSALGAGLLVLAALPASASAQRVHSHHESPNHIAAMVGVEFGLGDHGETGFVIGGDWAHHVRENTAVGVLGDLVFAESETVLKVGGGFSVRVWERVSLFAAPGVEFILSRDEEEEVEVEDEDDVYFFQRIGASYALPPRGTWTFTPVVSVDVSSSGRTGLTLGISVGRGG